MYGKIIGLVVVNVVMTGLLAILSFSKHQLLFSLFVVQFNLHSVLAANERSIRNCVVLIHFQCVTVDLFVMVSTVAVGEKYGH